MQTTILSENKLSWAPSLIFQETHTCQVYLKSISASHIWARKIFNTPAKCHCRASCITGPGSPNGSGACREREACSSSASESILYPQIITTINYKTRRAQIRKKKVQPFTKSYRKPVTRPKASHRQMTGNSFASESQDCLKCWEVNNQSLQPLMMQGHRCKPSRWGSY